MADDWTLAAEARRDFADLCDSLTPEQEAGTTLCKGWTPRHVAAHVATFVDVPFPKFIFSIMKHRGDFDAAADTMAREIAKRPLRDITATIRAKADKKSALPILPGGLTLVDAVVHAQDIRRGLVLPSIASPHLVRASLEFLTTNKRAQTLLEKKGLLDGLRFDATDNEWAHGDGELVRGHSEAILLAILRRPVHDELSGDGVATLRQRQHA